MSWRVMAVAVLALGGCRPEIPEGILGCERDADCPTGWSCREEGRCWKSAAHDQGGDLAPSDGFLPGDGQPADAGADDGPRCDDLIQNGGESDTDCGRVCPTRCQTGQGCVLDDDCRSKNCDASGHCSSAEDCFDGFDNDEDLATDCADSDCSAVAVCVPTVSVPWTGYYRVSMRDIGSGSPSPCRSGATYNHLFATPRDQGQCTPCGCSAWSGGTCAVAQLYCAATPPTNGTCPSPQLVPLPDDECHYRPFLGGPTMSCYVNAPAQTLGSCGPEGGEVVPSPMFAYEVDLCGDDPVGGGCGPGWACTAQVEDGYDQICVQASGENDMCPGDYPVRTPVYLDGVDSRACAPCVCDATTTCTATFEINDGAACLPSDPHVDDFSSPICAWVGWVNDDYVGGTWSVRRRSPPVASGSCAPAGGAPIGAVEPAGERTLCCRP